MRYLAQILFITFILLGLTIYLIIQKVQDRRLAKLNNPPEIISIDIEPPFIYAKSNIKASVKGLDPEGDSVIYNYTWFRNDIPINGAETQLLINENLKKNDIIEVEVEPNDGKVNGKKMRSKAVSIQNSPPFVKNIKLIPMPAYTNNNLAIEVIAEDTDEDFLTYTYYWTKNKTELLSTSINILDSSYFEKGDVLIAKVIAFDGESYSNTMFSQELTISNSPPKIISIPPSQASGMERYSYQVEVEDIDGDPVKFSLSESAPKGMRIDTLSGLVTYKPLQEDVGTYKIVINAIDSSGAKSIQSFTFTIGTEGQK